MIKFITHCHRFTMLSPLLIRDILTQLSPLNGMIFSEDSKDY